MSQQEADKLIFDQTCTHNLAKYLLNRKDKVTAIVVKPCDSRAINLLLNETRFKRDKVFIIGVVCPGIVETGWNKPVRSCRPPASYAGSTRRSSMTTW